MLAQARYWSEARKKEAAAGQAPQEQMAQAAFQAEMEDKAAKAALNAAKAEGQELENRANALEFGAMAGMLAG